MAAAVDVGSVIFFPSLLLLLLTVTSCLSMKLDEETKAFIRLVIENCDKEASLLCNGPVCAVPCGARVRTTVGSSSRAFLVPDVWFWIRCHISRIRSFSAHLAMIKIFKKPSIPSAGKMVVTTMTNLDSCMAFEMMCSL